MKKEQKVLLPMDGSLWFWCPACQFFKRLESGTWTMEGTTQEPTILEEVRTAVGTNRYCHLKVKSGKITYFKDSAHALAGKTVPMQEVGR